MVAYVIRCVSHAVWNGQEGEGSGDKLGDWFSESDAGGGWMAAVVETVLEINGYICETMEVESTGPSFP